MINESFYSNAREIQADINLVKDLKGAVAEHLRESDDKTQKIHHLDVRAKLHGFYLDPHGCISEVQENGTLTINVADHYKIMKVSNHFRTIIAGECAHSDSKKEFVIADLTVTVYDPKDEDSIAKLFYKRRDPITISRKPA
jgi:hypothetical protein